MLPDEQDPDKISEEPHCWQLGHEDATSGVTKVKDSLLVFFDDGGVQKVWIGKDLFQFIQDAVVRQAEEAELLPEYQSRLETIHPENYWSLTPPKKVDDFTEAIFGADGAPCNPD